ncbi:MAG: methylated-DNA--[protein]-cysteine S-methyltransferase [Limnohabitans sp.]
MNDNRPWQHCRTDSPLGPVRLARTARGLCGLWFELDHRHAPAAQCFAPAQHSPQDPLLREAVQQLGAYFQGQRLSFGLPLDLGAGTAFQQSVWQTLLTIPAGQTRSYQDLAIALGQPNAARAVGAAVGRNPVSIIVPCHRVLGSKGQLTGYAGGLWRKQALLQGENPSPP